MTTITQRDAKKAGMKPLSIPMWTTDPVLRTMMADMASIPSTVWAVVRTGMGRVAIWRQPNPLRAYSQGPKKEGRAR